MLVSTTPTKNMAALRESVSSDQMEALKRVGIYTTAAFLTAENSHLQSTGLTLEKISEMKAELLKSASVAILEKSTSAAALWRRFSSSPSKLTTGCHSIDQVLQGGFHCREITEIFGPSLSGKTQLCMNCGLATAEVSDWSVVVMDTTTSVSTERILEVLQRRGMSDQNTLPILERIRYYQVYNIFDAFSILFTLSEDRSVKLLIIDSVYDLISSILGGHLSEGHSLMTQFGQTLSQLAQQNNMAVVVTNGVVLGRDQPPRPALGKTWSHIADTRLQLTIDLISKQKMIEVVKSKQIPSSVKVTFNITDYGIQ